MARERDPIRIVEAAYRFEADEQIWIDGVLAAAVQVHPRAFAYTIDLRSAPLTTSSMATAPEVTEMIKFGMGVLRSIPAPIIRAAHEPSGHLLFGPKDIPAMLRARGLDPQAFSGLITEKTFLAHSIIGGEPSSYICLIGWFATPRELSYARRPLGRVASHLGAAVRLRRRLKKALGPDDAETDAVLTSTGKVLHARPSAQSKGDRQSLAAAVLRSELARTKRRATAEERLELWTALVEARWSIVEHVERDGKRVLLARKNAPSSPHLPPLNDRERAVTTFAAIGHSLKEIAYELGLPISTVSTLLRTSLLKLNLSSRVELVRLFGSLRTRS